MKTPSAELVPVPFYGDTMLATKVKDNCYTSLKRVCENIGVAYQPQHEKLRSCKWATITMIVTVAEDGKRRQVAMIDVRSLPMWLVTIHPSKVAFEVRDKLERYQMEAAEVLANHFVGAKKDNLPAIQKKLDKLDATLRHVEFYAGLWRTKAKQADDELRDLRNQLDLLMDPFKAESVVGDSLLYSLLYMTLAEFHAKHSIRGRDGKPVKSTSLPGLSRSVAAFSKSRGVWVQQAGYVNLYRIDVLQNWNSNRAADFRKEAERHESSTEMRLFA